MTISESTSSRRSLASRPPERRSTERSTRGPNAGRPRWSNRLAAGVLLALVGSACGPPKAVDVDHVLMNLDQYLGQRITVKARFKSGARCRQTGEQWQTYCKDDCQYCRGPLVVDTQLNLRDENLHDWAMILGGLHRGEDIRCKGPLNAIECHPFELGRPYVVRGFLERNHPPRLMVTDLWALDEE